MPTAARPNRTTIGVVLAVLGSLFIVYVGVRYLLTPQAMAAAFGLPAWPHDDGFLRVKGIRDVVSGLVILVVLAGGTRRVLGWVLLAGALTPLGDMVLVLTSGGSPATAFGVHGVTAAAVLLGASLLLSGSRTRSPQPAA
jgi:hypothetical protein